MLYTKLASDINEVDVIVAGGGTAGCIVAGRLAEADPTLSVLVIEGGANNHNVPSVLADREPIVPSGGTLGGGSSINFMMYTRGQREDFDAWNTEGWSSDELKPYLNKFENYHGPGKSEDHGRSGPINVSRGTYRAQVSEDDFIQAANQVGFPEIEDLQSLDTNNGIQRWQRYICPEGKRQDTAHRYIHPKLEKADQYPNLHVIVESKVVRVLLDDNKRAVGVEYITNPEFQPQGSAANFQPSKQTVRARKLVVVSCGACGTPASSSGPVSETPRCSRRRVSLLSSTSLVLVMTIRITIWSSPYRTNLAPDQTIDGLLGGRVDAAELIKNKDKLLGWNAIDISSKLRPTDAEVEALGPEFKATWDRDFKDAPNRPLMLMGLVSCFLGDPTAVPTGQYVSVGNYTAYPYSRGHIHITGADVSDPLDFDVGFFTDKDDIDLKKQIWAYKKSREIMRRTKMYRGEVALGHPKFPAGSPAACVELDAELSDVKDIEYSAEDDKAIEQWLRENIGTTWHSLGTAKMAPRDKRGVVASNLDVHGVQGLKLADLSVPPENLGANVNNTALLIGEKAADIIIKELGLAA
ncbi:unnamed protein product [Parascedosporium putredinis]|uniref:Alcohol oxidase n=1 Tax=Parascedosporium putredinis TaxID=1442378 RepID=A0A9P1M891_9PEZI|nr:unnamed protein product [Parascedosporium putredinis]CAI7989661.1 unnamed protein product [Parascedosporium putredinis]